jgi:hypothetical protein
VSITLAMRTVDDLFVVDFSILVLVCFACLWSHHTTLALRAFLVVFLYLLPSCSIFFLEFLFL